MQTLSKHTLFYLSVILVIGGLICLSTHRLTHLDDLQASPQQTTSDPIQKVSDNCALCIVSAFGFAEPEIQQFIPVHSESERISGSSFSFLSQQAFFAAAPRAPPVF